MTIDEVKRIFRSYSKKDRKFIARFFDSEHKIFSAFDNELILLQTRYGVNNVAVKTMNFKTLYKPCTSCIRQMVVRQEMLKFKLSVEAVQIKPGKYALGNRRLRESGILKNKDGNRIFTKIKKQ